MSLHKDYFRLVAQWEEICSRKISAPEKTDACLTELCGLIGRLALASAPGPSPALRFYASMLALGDYVVPWSPCGDELARTAVVPSFRLVHTWLKDNAMDRSPKQRWNSIEVTASR
jgi:hypothetical protein